MSLDNNNNDDKNRKNKNLFHRIMDKQGFYIILMLCLTIVAATAFWVDNRKGEHFTGENPTSPFEEDEQPEVMLVEDDKDSDEKTDKAKETGKIGEDKPAEDGEKSSGTPQEKPKENSETEPKEKTKGAENTPKKSNETKGAVAGKPSVKEVSKVGDKSPEKKDKTTEEPKDTQDLETGGKVPAAEVMAVPVMGKLALPFADDRLVYHKTLDQWSTHKGVDILATEGAPVKAALDGEVVEIINDTIMGISIAIRHNSELLTIYSNLSTDSMVKVGEHVKKGQTISGVGKTSSIKSLEGPLLHFQVLRDDKFVNPELYLGEVLKP